MTVINHQIPRGPNGEKDLNDWDRAGKLGEMERLMKEQEETEPAKEEPAPLLDLGEIPENFDARLLSPRPWVVADRLLQGYVTISAAPPGCGKSAFELASAASIAAGRSYTGEDYRRQGRAWFYANEEDTDEMLRRFGAFCLLHKLNPNDLRDKLRLSSGYGSSLVIARRVESTGDIIPTPVVEPLIRAIKDWNCLSFAVDPLISTHRVNENSNADLEAVMEQWRRVGSETNCAIEIPTHIPKTGEDSEGHAGNLNAIRGASSIGGAARQVITLARMSKKTADDYGVDEAEARNLVRLDRAKGNYSPPADGATWLQMRGICLDNDPKHPDWVGAFEVYPHKLQRVEGTRDAGKEERLSSLRVAVMQLDLKPGQKKPLSRVIDDLVSFTKLSKAWIQEHIVIALPKEGTFAAQDAAHSWSKDEGKTGQKFIHRDLP